MAADRSANPSDTFDRTCVASGQLTRVVNLVCAVRHPSFSLFAHCRGTVQDMSFAETPGLRRPQGLSQPSRDKPAAGGSSAASAPGAAEPASAAPAGGPAAGADRPGAAAF